MLDTQVTTSLQDFQATVCRLQFTVQSRPHAPLKCLAVDVARSNGRQCCACRAPRTRTPRPALTAPLRDVRAPAGTIQLPHSTLVSGLGWVPHKQLLGSVSKPPVHPIAGRQSCDRI